MGNRTGRRADWRRDIAGKQLQMLRGRLGRLAQRLLVRVSVWPAATAAATYYSARRRLVTRVHARPEFTPRCAHRRRPAGCRAE